MEADKVIIHVRFMPNGSVSEIGERPAEHTPQQWFDFLNSRPGIIIKRWRVAAASSG